MGNVPHLFPASLLSMHLFLAWSEIGFFSTSSSTSPGSMFNQSSFTISATFNEIHHHATFPLVFPFSTEGPMPFTTAWSALLYLPFHLIARPNTIRGDAAVSSDLSLYLVLTHHSTTQSVKFQNNLPFFKLALTTLHWCTQMQMRSPLCRVTAFSP